RRGAAHAAFFASRRAVRARASSRQPGTSIEGAPVLGIAARPVATAPESRAPSPLPPPEVATAARAGDAAGEAGATAGGAGAAGCASGAVLLLLSTCAGEPAGGPNERAFSG